MISYYSIMIEFHAQLNFNFGLPLMGLGIVCISVLAAEMAIQRGKLDKQTSVYV